MKPIITRWGGYIAFTNMFMIVSQIVHATRQEDKLSEIQRTLWKMEHYEKWNIL